MTVEQTSNQIPSLLNLFLRFIRLGLTAFGGPSMVAYIRKLAVEQQHWLDDESFRDGVVLCQMIPGATAMQAAAYVGLRARGVRGAAASFIGFGLPALGLMMVLSALYSQARTLPVVVAAFRGLQVIVVAIVANATVSFGRTSLKTWRSILLALVAATLFGLSMNPIFVIAIAALLGIVFQDRQFTPRASVSPMGMRRSARPLLFLIAAAASGFVLLFFIQRTLFDLAALMFRIDLFAFGGGFASIPLMFHEIVEVRGWLDSPTFLNGIVLGQITPGPIVITATFVGYQLYGLVGGLIATVGVFLPSFLLVTGTAPYFDRLRRSRYFNQAIGGVLCSFVGLLLTVTVRFAGAISWDVLRLLLEGTAFIALLRKVDILWVVLIGAMLSIILAL
ncbi:MAG TPA: chromate efflux transporter [Anaerolineae bacterium]|nr:chromate efflux transporter [Anaerolineae bacterium]